MVQTLSNKEVKARKEHTCNYCGGKINKGEVYKNYNLKYEDTMYTWKNHLKCSKLTSEETFNEFVQEFLYK